MNANEQEVILLHYVVETQTTRESALVYVKTLIVSRETKGEFHSLVNDIRMLEDDEVHYRYIRMVPVFRQNAVI